MNAVGRVAVGLALIWVSCSGCHAQAMTAGPLGVPELVVGALVPLSQVANGVDGELQILKDARITRAIAKQVWNTGGLDVEQEDYIPSSKESPVRNARIQVVARNGAVLDSEELERPLARIGTAHLYPNAKASYLLSVDYSAGFGSYSGPITFVVEVSGGRLHWVEAVDASGTRAKLRMMDSLKTAWRIVDASAEGKEILEAACRPTEKTLKTGGDFTITYSRFFFDGMEWRSVSRTVPGFTEFDGGFPSRRHFP